MQKPIFTKKEITSTRPLSRRPRNQKSISGTFVSILPKESLQDKNVQTSDTRRTKVMASAQRLKENLHVIPLGGLEEVGKNLYLFEYQDEIIMIDMGLMFPLGDMLGIDFVIPDLTYLKENQHKIKALILTHGHLDHMGAIPYILPKLKLDQKLDIFGTPLTIELVKQRLQEFGLENQCKLHNFKVSDKLNFKHFQIEFFKVTHNIPDGVGVVLRTPCGNIVHTGDFKFDFTPVDQEPMDLIRVAEIGSHGVMLLMSDSTNAEKRGHAISESKIGRNLDRLFSDARNRVIVATFATLISRIQQVINTSIKYERFICVSGLSMEKTIEAAVRLKYLKVPQNRFIPLRRANNLPNNKITMLVTGSQGQEASALFRMSRREHRDIKIKTGDTVIISSTPIPGNERAVYSMMDNLFKLGANVYYDKILDIHTSGHGRQEDLKLMLSLIQPKYFMPVHGEYHMLAAHARIARELGWDRRNIFVCTNGQIISVDKKGQAHRLREEVPAGYVMVDGLGVGDIGNVVLHDRRMMAQDGMFVIIMTIDRKSGSLVKEPDIVSRGFIYVKESETLLEETRDEVKKIMHGLGKAEISSTWPILKKKIRDDVSEFLFRKTERRPMVLPVIIEV